MDERPKLIKEISVQDFKGFYWLKSELQQFCRQEGLRCTGSKQELAQYIVEFLQTGKHQNIRKTVQRKTSTFDWQHASLTLETMITDNYRNTEHVRSFFKTQLGKSFRFNVPFMNWLKANAGKTLGDAVKEWQQLKEEARDKVDADKEIAPQFEYNRYLRDFLKNNPGRSREEGIRLWHIKKTKRGHNRYDPSDLAFLK